MSLVWEEPMTPFEIMDDAISKYNLNKLYVLFSGGKDSVCIAHFISTNYPDKFAGCVFTNTGIASQETRKFVISYCKEMGWKLYMTWPSDKERYYNIVMKHGFARQGNHRLVMGYIKYHSWYYFLKEKIIKGEKAAFISGVRKKESDIRNKRRLYTKHPVDQRSRFELFIKPFLYKNGVQLWDYFIENNLKKSGVYEWLNKSGECLCGSFTEPWELKMLEKFDQLSFQTIKWMEKQLQIKGTKAAKKHPKWGIHGSSAIEIEEQLTFENFAVNEDYCGESCQVYAEEET